MVGVWRCGWRRRVWVIGGGEDVWAAGWKVVRLCVLMVGWWWMVLYSGQWKMWLGEGCWVIGIGMDVVGCLLYDLHE